MTDADPTAADDHPRKGEGKDPAAPGRAGSPTPPDAAAGSPSVQLAPREQVPPPGQPARPPKRTGVFVDPDDLREHVGVLLRTMLGGYEVDAAGNYTFVHDSARIFVTIGISPVGPTVGVFSITNLEVEFTRDLGAFLLTTNHKLGFGAFSYDADSQAVWLKHTLLGTMLDGPELQAALMAIASTAARVDDTIRDRFGGRAFHDAPEEVQKRQRPPEQDDEDDPSSNASGYL